MRALVVLACLQALSLESTLTFAQTALTLPGCEPAEEVRSVLQEKLNGNEFDRLKFTEQMARRRDVLGDLIAKYPREVEPHRELIQATRWWDEDRFPALRDQYRKQAAQHPDDPLALYLAGVALIGKDSPQRVRLLEEAKAKTPKFPWPALELAFFYSGGKRADKQEASANIAAFFNACPDSTDRQAQRLLAKAGSTELQMKVAAALRARLSKETSRARLKEYETLWGLEFRTRPPQEHDALRKQLSADLKRLESLHPQPDAEWLIFLRNGYKQSGVSPEALKTLEDRIASAFPTSPEAFRIARERWRKDRKEPEDHKDAVAWVEYTKRYQEAAKRWMAQFSEPYMGAADSWYSAIGDDDSISETDGIFAMEGFLVAANEYGQPSPWDYMEAAEFLANHKWQPGRALVLLRKAQLLLAKSHEQESDNRTPEEVEEAASGQVFENQYLAGLMLRAARLAGKVDKVKTLRASIEGPPPKQKKYESEYWLNRARLAALDGLKTDALTYYQAAMRTRMEPARHRRGKLHDDLTEESRALWKEAGGTEMAWIIWSQPPAAKGQELAEGRWEKAEKPLPPFELADLSGRTWRLKSLEGKSVLINVWATWCGPCQSEQPKLQKLYEQVKDRSDVQILTFNIDEDAGLVAPYLKEKGYSFPVVVAYNYVQSLLDSIGIPQNWIVDPKGAWRWTQLGFDSAETDWPQSMLQRLESVKN